LHYPTRCDVGVRAAGLLTALIVARNEARELNEGDACECHAKEALSA
jgi:hypothetical protein